MPRRKELGCHHIFRCPACFEEQKSPLAMIIYIYTWLASAAGNSFAFVTLLQLGGNRRTRLSNLASLGSQQHPWKAGACLSSPGLHRDSISQTSYLALPLAYLISTIFPIANGMS